ncbi:MAG: TIGR01777 family oxidoreductase [Proteobacteria bacterium]|nr:TIGR01777 family oxidoreductase [Pseudomonadota bacterium]
MTSTLLWTLIALQIAMGAFDTLFHHELTERLAWRPSQRRELLLHGPRNLLYAALFVTLGWFEPHGVFAMAVMAVLAVELVITLTDFVEEDRTRKLPASERITHTLLALNYGAILVLLVPVLRGWAEQGTDIVAAWHGWWSVLAGASAFGVTLFGLRDIAAAGRSERLVPKPAGALVAALPRHQTILVTGTGFVGSRLVEALAAERHEVIVLTRDAKKAIGLAAPLTIVTDLDQIASDKRIGAIVHLAGEPISGGLWTARRRAAIVESRAGLTEQLAALVARLDVRPKVVMAASAVGWYGMRGCEPLTEEDAAEAGSFSHASCEACERALARVAAYGVRTVALRIGLVLGTEGGLLARLLLPFEFGMGGPVGSGAQWMSWIHRDDLVRLIAHAILTPSLSGPLNATAPEPVRNREFGKALGRALHRPAIMPLPAAAVRLLGDFGRELLLGGQRVLPHRAMASGFTFRYPTIERAFAAMLGGKAVREARAEAAHRLRWN